MAFIFWSICLHWGRDYQVAKIVVEMPHNAFQWWTVHFGISDVFQRFLSHLEPLNQNPSDAALAPLSILQNSRWRPRWPPSIWKLLKWPYFLCYYTQKCTFCVYLYVLPPKEYDGMGFNFYFQFHQIQDGSWPPSWKISNDHISGMSYPIHFHELQSNLEEYRRK